MLLYTPRRLVSLLTLVIVALGDGRLKASSQQVGSIASCHYVVTRGVHRSFICIVGG